MNPNKAPLSFLFLGTVFVFNGALYSLGLVLCAAALASMFQGSGSLQKKAKRVTGAVIIGLGARLAAEK